LLFVLLLRGLPLLLGLGLLFALFQSRSHEFLFTRGSLAHYSGLHSVDCAAGVLHFVDGFFVEHFVAPHHQLLKQHEVLYGDDLLEGLSVHFECSPAADVYKLLMLDAQVLDEIL
jgi:hypothetical protein